MGTLNFDAVPNTNPLGYINPGFYKAKLKTKEFKVNDKTNKEYLQVTHEISMLDGTKVGTLTDFFRDLDTSQLSLYKLSRLLQALDITGLRGDIELKLVVQMLKEGAEVAVEIGDNKYNGKVTSQVQVLNSQCYWPVGMLPGLLAANGGAPGAVTVAPAPAPAPQEIPANPDEFPFDAADGRVPPAETATATGVTTAPGGDNY